MSRAREFVVVEQFIKGKKPTEEHCEDALVINEHFFAIVDGATSKASSGAISRVAPGRLIAQTIAQGIQRLDPYVKARAAIDELTKVAQALNERQVQLNEERASASVVILSLAHAQVWRVGDCLVRVGGRMHPPKCELEQNVAAVRAAYNQVLLFNGRTVEELQQRDLGRELILPILKSQHVLANAAGRSRFAFGALDGNDVPDELLEIIDLPGCECEIVLCSDGYASPTPTLQEAEADLAASLKADPLCISEIIATKGKGVEDLSYDDRAYIRVSMR